MSVFEPCFASEACNCGDVLFMRKLVVGVGDPTVDDRADDKVFQAGIAPKSVVAEGTFCVYFEIGGRQEFAASGASQDPVRGLPVCRIVAVMIHNSY